MDLSLAVHLSVHFFSGVLAGYLSYLAFRKPLPSFIFGVIGGFLIDLDHFIDFFLAFGFSKGFDYFLNSYQFLASGKLYVLFHAYEYLVLILLFYLFVKKIKAKAALLALLLGMIFHIGFDIAINEMPFKAYSVLYRASNSFQFAEIFDYGPGYESFLKERKSAGFR